MTDYGTTKYERDGRTGALISKDVAALNARKKEIENRRKIQVMETQIASLNDKMDTIIKLLTKAE